MVASKKRKASLGKETSTSRAAAVNKKAKVNAPAPLLSATPLSAVAARRAAAAAASAAVEAVEIPEVSEGDQGTPEGDEEEAFLAVAADSEDDVSLEREQPEAGPSSPPKHAKPGRYFVAPVKAAASKTKGKKGKVETKAFSPSLAVIALPDASESEEDEDEGNGVDDEVSAVADDDEGGNDDQSLGDSDEEEDEEDEEVPVVPAPIMHVGRRARKGKAPENGSSGSFSSTFVPEEGVNVCRVSADVLSHLGRTFEAAAVGGAGVVVSLCADETLAIAGMVHVTPLQGSILLESTSLQPSTTSFRPSYRLFGPTSHPIPVLSAEFSQEDQLLSKNVNKALQLPSTFALQAGSTLRTVFLITELCCGLEGLRGAVPGFSRLWPDGEGAFGVRGFHPIIGSFPQPVYPHTTPKSWSAALASLPSPPGATVVDNSEDWDSAAEEAQEEARNKPFIGMVKGPKRSGKSTFARAMANQLLTTYERVAFLECDLGQSEFGCGGVVGLYVIDKPLLGPSFTHPDVPVRSHFIGAYSPKSSPDHYLDSIHALLEHYRFEVQYDSSSPSSSSKISESTPLVVNTQGWVKGLGMDLLRSIEQMASPSHVFAFEAAVVEDEDSRQHNPGWTRSPEFETVALPQDNPWGMPAHSEPVQHFVLTMPPLSPLMTRYAPADLRTLSTMAYFHSTLSSSPTWDFSRPLVAQRPWQIQGCQVLRSIVLSGEGSDCIVEEDVPLALNGSIVALVSSTADLEAGSSIYAQGRTVPPPAESTCLALALIRALTPALELQLLTPLPASRLAEVNTLVKGELELPLCAMVDEDEDGVAGVSWDAVPFLEIGPVPRGAVGMAKRRFRRNLQRKGM